MGAKPGGWWRPVQQPRPPIWIPGVISRSAMNRAAKHKYPYGYGSMSHEDSMRSLKLMGEEVLPALREMGDELDLPGPYDFDPPIGWDE